MNEDAPSPAPYKVVWRLVVDAEREALGLGTYALRPDLVPDLKLPFRRLTPTLTIPLGFIDLEYLHDFESRAVFWKIAETVLDDLPFSAERRAKIEDALKKVVQPIDDEELYEPEHDERRRTLILWELEQRSAERRTLYAGYDEAAMRLRSDASHRLYEAQVAAEKARRARWCQSNDDS